MIRPAVAALAAAAALVACSRPRPSPEYERARAVWTALVQAKGDAAAEDPGADDVLARLSRVPRDSADADAAAELRARIEAERRARAEERDRRAKLVARAGAPQAVPVPRGEGGAGAEAAAGAEGAATPDLPVGMSLEDFRREHGTCFEPRGPVAVAARDGGPPSPGEVWALKADPACLDRNPAMEGKVVLFTGGALASVAPAAAIRKVETRERVTLGTLPDGGVGIQQDGGVVPVPPGATLTVDPVDGGRP